MSNPSIPVRLPDGREYRIEFYHTKFATPQPRVSEQDGEVHAYFDIATEAYIYGADTPSGCGYRTRGEAFTSLEDCFDPQVGQRLALDRALKADYSEFADTVGSDDAFDFLPVSRKGVRTVFWEAYLEAERAGFGTTFTVVAA